MLRASKQNLLFLQGRWIFASLQSIQQRLLRFLFEQDMNTPLELKWATFVTLCPTDQSTVPAPGSFRALSCRSSCPRSCSASLCWSPARWPRASSWTVRCPLQPISLSPHSLATWPCCRRQMCQAGAQQEAWSSTQVYLPAAQGIVQCSSRWFECAVVYVSSLWVTFWQSACQVIVLKSAKERKSPLQFLWVYWLSFSLQPLLCSATRQGVFTVQESRLDFGTEFPCNIRQHPSSHSGT